MVDYTDDTKWPDGEMEHTRGIWVRKNRREDQIEIWFDGSFQSAWRSADNIDGRLTTMLREAFDIGKRAAKKEIRDMLGCK